MRSGNPDHRLQTDGNMPCGLKTFDIIDALLVRTDDGTMDVRIVPRIIEQRGKEESSRTRRLSAMEVEVDDVGERNDGFIDTSDRGIPLMMDNTKVQSCWVHSEKRR